MRAQSRRHASLRNDTGVDGEAKGQGCSTLQIRTLSSIAQAPAAIAKQILPWQRASPRGWRWCCAGLAGEAELEEERDVWNHCQQRCCEGRAVRLQSCRPAKSIKPTEIQSREERKQASCQK